MFSERNLLTNEKEHIAYPDDTASDTMVKKLADRFTVNSTYADRSKAEFYAKKGITKDYFANKWTNAMAKKDPGTSPASSYTSYSSSRSYSNHPYNIQNKNKLLLAQKALLRCF